MSRTDKDRPYWVTTYQDGDGRIDHDHRNGVCIEEDLELAKFYRTGPWRHGRHHNCNKVVRVDFACYPGKVNGRRQILFTVDVPEPRDSYRWKGYIDNNRRMSCWTRTCDCGHDETDYLGRIYCDFKYNTACFGHWYTYRDNTRNCICDTWPERPTCDLAGPNDTRGGWRRYTWGGVPTDFVRRYYHRPERARERKLNDMAREYNTYGDIEDDDFDNRQARNSCRWLYW